MTLRPEWVGAEENVRIGLDWIQNDQQPADAVMSQFGSSVHVGGFLRVQVSAGHFGSGGSDPTVGLIVFQVHNPNRDKHGDETPAPFTDNECVSLRGLVERHPGIEVARDWNGPGCDSYSVAFRGCAPSVYQAYRNYGRDHGGIQFVRPTWVEVAMPTPSAPGVPEDDRNLRAVKEALERIRPVLAAEFGIHPDTVVAGRRGDITEDGDVLSFDPKAGHGVCLPAEAAIALVEAATRLAGERS